MCVYVIVKVLADLWTKKPAKAGYESFFRKMISFGQGLIHTINHYSSKLMIVNQGEWGFGNIKVSEFRCVIYWKFRINRNAIMFHVLRGTMSIVTVVELVQKQFPFVQEYIGE